MNLQQQRAISLRNHLKATYTQARGNLLLMLVCTALNLLLLATGVEYMILFSATVPYLSMAFGLLAETGVLLIPGVLLSLAIVAVYFLCWLLSKKNPRWLMAALVLFIIDTVCLVAFYILAKDFTGIMDVLFHAWVLYYLISGVRANKRLEKLPPEDVTYVDDFRLEDVPAEETAAETPATEEPAAEEPAAEESPAEEPDGTEE